MMYARIHMDMHEDKIKRREFYSIVVTMCISPYTLDKSHHQYKILLFYKGVSNFRDSNYSVHQENKKALLISS